MRFWIALGSNLQQHRREINLFDFNFQAGEGNFRNSIVSVFLNKKHLTIERPDVILVLLGNNERLIKNLHREQN